MQKQEITSGARRYARHALPRRRVALPRSRRERQFMIPLAAHSPDPNVLHVKRVFRECIGYARISIDPAPAVTFLGTRMHMRTRYTCCSLLGALGTLHVGVSQKS